MEYIKTDIFAVKGVFQLYISKDYKKFIWCEKYQTIDQGQTRSIYNVKGNLKHLIKLNDTKYNNIDDVKALLFKLELIYG